MWPRPSAAVFGESAWVGVEVDSIGHTGKAGVEVVSAHFAHNFLHKETRRARSVESEGGGGAI